MLLYKLNSKRSSPVRDKLLIVFMQIMTQSLEKIKKKKSSRHGKKKHTPTPSESSEEEEMLCTSRHPQKHIEPSDSGEGGSQRPNELERHLDTLLN